MAAEKDKQKTRKTVFLWHAVHVHGIPPLPQPPSTADATSDFYLKTENRFVPHPDKALTLMSTPPHGEQSA